MAATQYEKRHAQLCAEIARHDHQYYVLDAPVISDREYDRLFDELRALERAHPELVTPSSPTQRIGERPREGVVKVEHETPMFSLDNSYDEADLREFDRRVREALGEQECAYVAEPKLDGASLEVVYRDGLLTLGATRGDGRVGEDVTANVRTIRGVPLTLRDQRVTSLRGEVVIYKRDLEEINQARVAREQPPFANPRNAASGWLRLLDSREAAARPLRVFFYDRVERYCDSHHQTLAELERLGLPTHKRQRLCANIDEVLQYAHALERERHSLPFEIDGVVVKVDRLAQRDRLGFTARFPRWAIAYKYEAERALTVVRGIEADVGRTGALTPVARLDPVQLSGTVVSRASLHNIDYVADKDVRVGDSVRIEKAGEIIPQVIDVELSLRPEEETEPWEPPTHCPVCATPVVRDEDAAALRCPNPRCPGRVKAGLFYFTRRSAMDVERLGRALVEQLVDAGLLRDVADIFALADKRSALLSLPRMADKSADNVLLAIERARRGRTLSQLLTGLGIPLVGTVAATLIAERYRSLQAMLDADPEAMRQELAELHGIGPKIADSVAGFFAAPQQREVMQKLLDHGVRAEQPVEQAPADGALRGKSFCVTGTLSEPRDAIFARIRAAGGEIHKSVKRGTDYLVAGEKVGANKTRAAEKVGAQVIDEAALRAMLEPGADSAR